MTTGYEQVRSVVAALAGDMDAAARVELSLPETGVCGVAGTAGEGCCDADPLPEVTIQNTTQPDPGCCGGPAPDDVEACCVKDAEAKKVGEAGCGCGTA